MKRLPEEAMKRQLLQTKTLAVLAILTLCACAGSKIVSSPGLYTGEIGQNLYPTAEPGETKPLARMYKNAPPMIPHSIADFTIERTNNDCLSCHQDGGELSEGHVATKVPPSHYLNEHTGERAKDGVLGIRYNCLQCHTPQSAESPPSRATAK